MHPNPSFDWTDRESMLAFLRETSFATIFIAGPSGPLVAHAPLLVAADGERILFHLSRRNAAAVTGAARALVSCLGAHGYVSPDWYGTDDQVPTWNYVVVECEGSLAPLPDADLPALLDSLSALHEARLAPKPAWTRAKMSAGRFEAMLGAIRGYDLRIESLRGTRKLGQNKSAAEQQGACAGLRAAGLDAIAELMDGPRA